MNEKINAYIDSKREDFVNDLRRLVEINSVRSAGTAEMPFGEGGARALKEAQEILSAHGYESVNYENYAVEADFGPAPNLMILAHLDVVPAGDGWTREPYRLTEEGDLVYGRGTTDDKGPAVASLLAMDACRAVYGAPKTGVRLVLGSGEETGSEDMEHYFSKRPTLGYTLSPDASFPLINLEKGRFAPFFTKKTENNGFIRILEISGGSTQNIVPGKASALVSHLDASSVRALFETIAEECGVELILEDEGENLRVFVNGQSAHAAGPDAGVNAQTALIQMLLTLPIKADGVRESLEALGALFPHGDTEGEALGVKMRDEESGRLTLNFGVLKFDGETFTCGMDLRCPLCANEKNVKAQIERKLGAAGFSFVGDPEMRPVHYVPASSPLVQTCLKVYEDHTGEKGYPVAIGGGTYVHEIEGGVAFGVEFPGRDYRIHGADEFSDVNELLLTAKMYADVIKELCY